jgi:imidazolonepropionase-like amidohydrolase
MAGSHGLSITNVAIFDGESEHLTEGPIRIVDGRIAEVAGTVGVDDRVLDARGGVAIPGLIDAHFHAYAAAVELQAIARMPLSFLALVGANRLRRALTRGFTTVRDVAGGDAGLDRAIRQGLIRAPRYLYAGAALSQTGGHGDGRAAGEDCCGHQVFAEVVDGVDNLRRSVRDRFRNGAHVIKIMASGGVVSPSDPIRAAQYSPDEIRAVVDEATRRGSYVAAHAYSIEAIQVCVEAGVRSIEHGNLLDAPTAAAMAGRGAFLVPTLVTYDAMERRGAEIGMSASARAKNREVLQAGRQALELARAAGVPIGFGSDLMGDLEDDQLLGLRLQAEVDGLLPTLRAATSGNAALIGRSELGHIAVDAAADLVVLPVNPFDHPEALWSGRRTVVRAGEIVD